MTIAKGTHNLGPDDGKVLVNVYKEGALAKMGHDLTLEATDWSAKADINPDDPSSSSISVTVDAGSLEIISPADMPAKDKADIAKNITKTLGRGAITFESTGVSGSVPSISLKGNLTISGNSNQVTLNLTVDDNGSVTGKTSFTHKQFGIKPFSAPLGVLKVKDGVDITVEVQLPTA